MKKNNPFIKSLQQKHLHLLRIVMIAALMLSLFASGCTPASTAHASKNTFYASIMNGSKQGIKNRMIEVANVFGEMDIVYRSMVKGVLPEKEAKEMLKELHSDTIINSKTVGGLAATAYKTLIAC